MKINKKINRSLLAAVLILLSVNLTLQSQSLQYSMPVETSQHEGTWLAWPHDSTYYSGYREFFEPAWVEMTRELVKGENVHIIIYNQAEQDHVMQKLTDSGVSLAKVDFYIHPTDDYWIRDNGPIFVKDASNVMAATDWDFDGWGNDAAFALDNVVPALVAGDLNMNVINLNTVELEGGAVASDGFGTFMGTESSILGDGRNPGLTTDDMEEYMTTYLGFTHFIWLDGTYGGNFDITDSHIDGFATFLDTSTIVTMKQNDLLYWFVTQSDINTLYNATNKNGNHYNYVYLPLTKKVVKTTTGVSTNSKGSYMNYYVANAVVLVPTYADENDAVAIAIVQGLYPDKQVVGIDCRNMFSWGGMVHCVTQQQPVTCPQACSIPTQLSTTKITTTTAKANWQLQNCSVKYKLRYRKTNSTAWTNVSVAADKSSKVFKNLSVNSPYEWQIRNKCQETPLIQSAWSASQFFTTLPLKNAVAIDQSAFTLYPNPANESVTIQHAMDVDEEVEIEIYDVTGKRWVQLHTVGAGDCTIDLTGFESGLYLVKMGSVIQKLVKE